MKSQATSHRAYQQTARAEAAEATARKIVEAFLSKLMTQWYDEITLDRIAEDAGVTVQTVVRRFGGKEGLLKKAVQIMSAQINAQRATRPGDIDGLVDNLIADYEQTGDAVIRLLALESRQPALQEFLEIGRGEHRRWIATSFDHWLKGLDSALQKQALDALVIVTDVYTWKLLRRDMARGVTATKSTLRHLIQATISEFSMIPRSEEGK